MKSVDLTRGRLAALGVVVVVVLVLVFAALLGDSDVSGTTPSADDPSAGPSATVSGSPDPDDTPGGGGSSEGPGGTGEGTATPGGGKVPTQRAVRVALDDPGRASKVVTVRATRLEWVKGQSRVRGEVGGPSLRVTVVADNRSGRTVDIGTALVNAYYGADDRPASPLSGPGGKPFPSTLRPNGTAQGRFVFQMPQRGQVPVRIEVFLDNRLTVVNFVGEPASVM